MSLHQIGLQDTGLEKPRTREELKAMVGGDIPITSYYHDYLRGYHYQKSIVCPFCKTVLGVSGVDNIPWECPGCGAT